MSNVRLRRCGKQCPYCYVKRQGTCTGNIGHAGLTRHACGTCLRTWKSW